MRRLIELVSALTATTIGLIGVATEVRALVDAFDNTQLASLPNAVGPQSWSVISSQINHFMALLAVLLVGLSAGAYLHALYRSTWGLALLWICTASLIVAVGFATLTPPSFAYTGGSISALAVDVVPTALPVLTVVLAAVSAVAAITPLQPGSFPQTAAWLRRLDRIVHPQPPV